MKPYILDSLNLALKTITGFRGEGTKAKRFVGNAAIDGIATRRGQAQPFSSTTASAQCTYLEASQLPSTLFHGNSNLICFLVMKTKKFEARTRTNAPFETRDH
ncbi:unnamed protein product [Lupinus luteus]|uniref:Uncharacterized protein n=1 Tax=Lupinus luteus TaxID=3873 RepID=A0AAV1VSJ2_LUPLU